MKHSHDYFLTLMQAAHITADSANYAFYEAFYDMLLCDGGDDDFADSDSGIVALLFCCFLTTDDINAYDAADENNEVFEATYHRIKSLILDLPAADQ